MADSEIELDAEMDDDEPKKKKQKVLQKYTRSAFLTAKLCSKFVYGWGSAPDPAGGAHSAPPAPLTGWGGGNPLLRPNPLGASVSMPSLPRFHGSLFFIFRSWQLWECRRLLLCALNRRSGVNRYPQCRLHWLVLGCDHSARPDSTQLKCVKLSWVRSGIVPTALAYSKLQQGSLYLGLLVWSVDLCTVEQGDRRGNRSHNPSPRQLHRVNIVLLTTAVAVDVWVVMRHEGKVMGQMIDLQCMVHSAPIFATDTDTAVVCQTKHRHRPSCKFLPL